MTFKELKEGDKLYIVNEGKNFGIRIEEHVIKGITKECGDLVIKLDDTCSAYIDEMLIDSNRCGFYFINKKDAEDYFLSKYYETCLYFIGRATQYLKQYNNCVEIMNSISAYKEEIEKNRTLV